MATLHLSHSVTCAAGQAPRYFERFFTEHAQEGVVMVALRAPIALPGLPPLMLSRDCLVRLRPAPGAGAAGTTCDVVWEPAGGGPFPRFAGTIAVAGDGAACALVLNGTYDAPAEGDGRPFDATLGHAVAESTGRDVLERLGSYIDRTARAVDAAKANRAAANP